MTYLDDLNKITKQEQIASKPKKLAPPWNFATIKPPEDTPIVFFDGLTTYAGIYSKRVGKPDVGGFATVTRKVKRNSSIDTIIHLVDNVRSWMLIPDQVLEK